VEITINGLDRSELDEDEANIEIEADISDINANQDAVPTAKKSIKNKSNAGKGADLTSSEDGEDDYACVPLSNIDRGTMTFKNRE